MKKHFYKIIFLAGTAGLLYSCAGKKMAHFSPSSPKSYDYAKTKAQTNTESKETAFEYATQVNNLVKPVIKESYTTNATKESKATETTNTVELVQEAPVQAITENMSKKDIKKVLKEASSTTNDRTAFMNILLVIFAIILPPLAVVLVDGLRGPFWLSILLTLIFWLPGFIYALIRVFKQR
jgi:uncharacterized membrane protein YqaE (UPF0057 family)